MDNVRRVFLLSGVGVTIFATGLLGGLGASSAGHASIASLRASRAVSDAQKEVAGTEMTAAIISTIFYLGSLVAFAVVMLYMTYR